MNIDISILSAELDSKNKTIEILAEDTSQMRLDRLMENRVDREQELTFSIPLDSKKGYYYFLHWINDQRAFRDAQAKSPKRLSWGEALYSIIGTDTMISSKYMVYE